MSTKRTNTAGLRARTLSLAITAATAAAAGNAAAEEWQWSATPYLWATDLRMGLTVRDRTIVDTEIAFDDLVEKVDGATMVRIEGMRGRHGMAFDLFNVELADAHAFQPAAAPGPSLDLELGVGLSILDATGVYDFDGGDEGFSLIYGARAIELRNDIDATLSAGGMTIGTRTFDSADRLVDGLIGFRLVRKLPHDFHYEMRVDVSTGDTELTWSAGPTIGYRFGDNDRYEVTAGYRRMDIDFETAEPVEADMSMSGVSVGFRINF
jgi:hypothetical protein